MTNSSSSRIELERRALFLIASKIVAYSQFRLEGRRPLTGLNEAGTQQHGTYMPGARSVAESFLAEDTLISGRDASQTHHPVRPKRLSSSGDLPRADLGCGRSGIGRGISD